jgi:xanthine/uracil permease
VAVGGTWGCLARVLPPVVWGAVSVVAFGVIVAFVIRNTRRIEREKREMLRWLVGTAVDTVTQASAISKRFCSSIRRAASASTAFCLVAKPDSRM